MASRSRNVTRIAGLALLLLLPSIQAAHPVPASQGPQYQSLGMSALQSSLLRDGFYTETSATGRIAVDQQMMVVLALLRSASLRPDQRDMYQTEALRLWNAAQAAYDPLNQHYHLVYPAPADSICIGPEVQGWILRAIRALGHAGLGNASVLSRRAQEVRSTILDLLESGQHAGKPICPGSERDHHPISIGSLVETRVPEPDPRMDRIVPLEAAAVVQGFREGAVYDVNSALYLTLRNAQTLFMLTEVTRAYPTPELVRGRESLLGFLLNRTIEQTASGPVARDVSAEGAFAQGDPRPANQIWLAYALNHYDALLPGRVPGGLVAGLMSAYFQLFWRPDEGAFRGTGELLSLEPNAMVAILSNSGVLSGIGTETSELALSVPPSSLTDYTSAANAAASLVNAWDIRFQLSSDANAPVDLLLVARDLDSFRFGPDQAIELFRITGATRTPVTNVRVYPGDTPAIRFTTELTTVPAQFRLEGQTPIRPLISSFDNRIRVVVDNEGDRPILIRTFRLEVSAVDVKIDSVKLNQATVPNPEIISPLTTDEVREPHTRILIRDLQLPAGQSEIIVEYTDVVPPQIEKFGISRDPLGRDTIAASPTGVALQGEPLYVRAVVRDNAVLRGVLLRYQFGQEVVERPMMEGDRGVFTYPIPRNQTNSTGTFQWQVVAIDAASNLNQTAARFILIENPLLSGSRVLFAFSGTLFLSALIIWAKVRRKAR